MRDYEDYTEGLKAFLLARRQGKYNEVPSNVDILLASERAALATCAARGLAPGRLVLLSRHTYGAGEDSGFLTARDVWCALRRSSRETDVRLQVSVRAVKGYPVSCSYPDFVMPSPLCSVFDLVLSEALREWDTDRLSRIFPNKGTIPEVEKALSSSDPWWWVQERRLGRRQKAEAERLRILREVQGEAAMSGAPLRDFWYYSRRQRAAGYGEPLIGLRGIVGEREDPAAPPQLDPPISLGVPRIRRFPVPVPLPHETPEEYRERVRAALNQSGEDE